MDLKVKHYVSNSARYILGEPQGPVNGAVGALHVEYYAEVIDQAKVTSNFSYYGDDLGATWSIVIIMEHMAWELWTTVNIAESSSVSRDFT
ncbi:hypothetical protein C0993_008884 [Termitomyces sp. T159_Od127]|nr:hypothetical protein C0993_008884 [Termitomyces sp. T159_Od127]